MPQLNFGQLSFGTTTSQFVGLPMEDIKALSENLQQRYNVGKESFIKLKEAADNVQVEKGNTHIKDEAFSKVASSFQEVSDMDNFQYADDIILKTASDFKNNKDLKGAVTSKVLFDKWLAKMDTDKVDAATKNKALSYYQGTFKAIQTDEHGVTQNIFNQEDVVAYPDIDKKVLELEKNSKGSTTPYGQVSTPEIGEDGKPTGKYVTSMQPTNYPSSTSMMGGNTRYNVFSTIEQLNEQKVTQGTRDVMYSNPEVMAYLNQQAKFNEAMTYMKNEDGTFYSPSITPELESQFSTSDVAMENGRKYIKGMDGQVREIDANFSYEQSLPSVNINQAYINDYINEINKGKQEGDKIVLDNFSPQAKESFYKNIYDFQKKTDPVSKVVSGTFNVLQYQNIKYDIKEDSVYTAQVKASLDRETNRLKLDYEANLKKIEETSLVGIEEVTSPNKYQNIDDYQKALETQEANFNSTSINAAKLLIGNGVLNKGDIVLGWGINDNDNILKTVRVRRNGKEVIISGAAIPVEIKQSIQNANQPLINSKLATSKYLELSLQGLSEEDFASTMVTVANGKEIPISNTKSIISQVVPITNLARSILDIKDVPAFKSKKEFITFVSKLPSNKQSIIVKSLQATNESSKPFYKFGMGTTTINTSFESMLQSGELASTYIQEYNVLSEKDNKRFSTLAQTMVNNVDLLDTDGVGISTKKEIIWGEVGRTFKEDESVSSKEALSNYRTQITNGTATIKSISTLHGKPVMRIQVYDNLDENGKTQASSKAKTIYMEIPSNNTNNAVVGDYSVIKEYNNNKTLNNQLGIARTAPFNSATYSIPTRFEIINGISYPITDFPAQVRLNTDITNPYYNPKSPTYTITYPDGKSKVFHTLEETRDDYKLTHDLNFETTTSTEVAAPNTFNGLSLTKASVTIQNTKNKSSR